MIHLQKAELFTTVIPSKIFECFGMGVPVLFAGPTGEGAGIVKEHGAGVVVPAEDPLALCDAVTRLAQDPAELARLSTAARAAAPAFDRRVGARRMADVLLRAASNLPANEEELERTDGERPTCVDRAA